MGACLGAFCGLFLGYCGLSVYYSQMGEGFTHAGGGVGENLELQFHFLISSPHAGGGGCPPPTEGEEALLNKASKNKPAFWLHGSAFKATPSSLPASNEKASR
jgi:hypothetical protein